MKLVNRKASTRWNGSARGRRHDVKRRVLKRVSYTARVSRQEDCDTHPAELLAVAHAASFALALTKELGLAASPPGKIVITATVTLERQVAFWTITNIHLNVLAQLHKVTQSRFIDAAIRAKTKCLVSRLSRVNISMNAKLEK